MSIIFKNGGFFDERCPENKIFNGGNLSICYTLLDDDITKCKRVSATPYTDRADELAFNGDCFVGVDTKSVVSVSSVLDGVKIELNTKNDNVSELGFNLPFNFMGKKNGGGWSNQYLFNSPYMSYDKGFFYAYLESPNKNNIIVAMEAPFDGWKMDYSPYLWAHYFVNLKLLANYDRAYNTGSKNRSLSFVMLPASSLNDGLQKLSLIFELPFITYSASGGKIGDKICLYIQGSCDSIIELHDGKESVIPYTFCYQNYEINHLGETTLIPCFDGKRGAPVTIYGYESLEKLYKKSMDTVDLDTIKNHTDGNLCEHQCWASAMLRFLLKYKHMLTEGEVEIYEGKVLSFLDILTEQDESKAVPRQTILSTPHDIFPAYNVYKSRRVQELFFGITILLDAYKYFKEEKYLRYVIGATECLTSFYQKDDGGLYIDWGNGHYEDYTTVCCPMIPLLDVANALKGIDDALSSKYFNCATKMAEFLYNRGLSFPTEGGTTDLADGEMEDGSISCTALALLYYCKNGHRVDKYVEKAKEILDVHSSWQIKTPICQMHYSTLRWWETQWEGDADGPAICAGHSWTIWRAEADYLYYELTGEIRHLRMSRNAFLTNLSKIDSNGNTYSIYNPDEINGGGFDKPVIRIANRFASVKDCGISRYVWIRINETFLK